MKWELKQFLSNFKESSRTFDIGDNIAITYTTPFTPIKINGTARPELKFKSSFCIYDVWDEELNAEDYNLEIEMIAIEEYSDSPNSIYIDEMGTLNTDDYNDIKTIELGDVAILYTENGLVAHYEIFEVQDEV